MHLSGAAERGGPALNYAIRLRINFVRAQLDIPSDEPYISTCQRGTPAEQTARPEKAQEKTTMADEAGKDLLLEMFATMQRIETKIDGLDTRMNHTNDTMALIGSVLHRGVTTVGERIEDHERRIEQLER